VKREIVAEPEIDAFTQERIGGMDGNRETVTPGGRHARQTIYIMITGSVAKSGMAIC
jgi:hypothetical protein